MKTRATFALPLLAKTKFEGKKKKALKKVELDLSLIKNFNCKNNLILTVFFR